ncbi:MAG: RluA family pseudouridine synthase [Chromatiales bacterium]|nr:RluA family pseudouridine synthase [Chromatiales bacterium]
MTITAGPSSGEPMEAVVPLDLAGERLDRALGQVFPQFSRGRLQVWLRDGRALVDGRAGRPSERVRGGERIALSGVDAPGASPEWAADPIALHIVHADTDVVVVDKPAGLVTHPGAGNPRGTLANALLHRFPELAAVPRAGVVHRLDKDTSGLLVVARSLPAHAALVAAIKARAVRREYLAVVHGRPPASGVVDAPIGRHPTLRTRMAVVAAGRDARTHFRVIRELPGHAVLALRLESGRTHQIRVHMAHLGHPLVGDPTYAGRSARRGATRLDRQALHATRLAFEHPASGEALAFESPPSPDIVALIDDLACVEAREDRR